MKLTSFGVAVVEGDTHLSKWIEQHGRLDIAREYLLQFREHIPEGGLVVDAGACLGDHTATYAEFVGLDGHVLAYEPNPVAFECLKHNMARFPNVRAMNAALGRDRGSVGVLSAPNLGASQVTTGSKIPIVRIDDMWRGDDRVAFLKIDVEGYEPDVIAGAMETLRRDRPVLLVEINAPILAQRGYTARDIIDPLESLGYTVKPAESHWTFDMPQIDVLCLPG